ncbi:hypothetical protein B0T17DRAFT_505340 [Bombardia bombarda]|uniref:Uncharacterized protein n=1 Tax=Bombardia bombarda TaxID=252184 RepID=A0AA39X8H7_9PEZI|nr:hypothetical protein B0T17DRAFT_505340 [Bombardia bombarda]
MRGAWDDWLRRPPSKQSTEEADKCSYLQPREGQGLDSGPRQRFRIKSESLRGRYDVQQPSGEGRGATPVGSGAKRIEKEGRALSSRRRAIQSKKSKKNERLGQCARRICRNRNGVGRGGRRVARGRVKLGREGVQLLLGSRRCDLKLAATTLVSREYIRTPTYYRATYDG